MKRSQANRHRRNWRVGQNRRRPPNDPWARGKAPRVTDAATREAERGRQDGVQITVHKGARKRGTPHSIDGADTAARISHLRLASIVNY